MGADAGVLDAAPVSSGAHDELIRLTATEAAARLKRGDITPLDLIDAAERRIAEVEPAINALPTLCFDRAREHARRLMRGERREAEGEPGWLGGLPVAIKDLADVAGVRTTYGSPIFRDHVPKTVAPGGGAHRAQGRHRHRQVEHAGIRRRRLHLQRGVRAHAQPLEHGADIGRLDGRRSGSARCRRGVAGARLRSCGKPAPSRHLLLGRGLAALGRPRHPRHLQQPVRSALRAGADGAHRGRRGAVSRRHDGIVPARSPHLRGAAPVVCGGRRQSGGAEARRLHGDVRRQGAGRPGDARDLRQRRAAVRGAWRGGGGGGSRPRRHGRGVSGAALAALCRRAGADARDAPRVDQAGHRLEHRARPEADPEPDRGSRAGAGRALPAHGRVLRRPTISSSRQAPRRPRSMSTCACPRPSTGRSSSTISARR